MSIDLTRLPYDPDRVYEKPLYELTQSAVACYQTCPQKYALRYLMRIAPATPNIALTIGSAVHAAFDVLMDPKNTKLAATQPQKVRNAWTAAIDKAFDSTIETTDIVHVANADKLDHARAQAHAIVEAWQIVNGTYAEHFKVAQTEFNIRARKCAVCDGAHLTNDAATDSDPEAWTARLAGKIDAVVVDGEGATWIFERKTKGSLSDVGFLQGLELDHQVLFYAILYDRHLRDTVALAKKRDKMRPKGFYYDVMVKPLHRTGDTFAALVARMVKAMVEDPSRFFCFTPIEITDTMVAVARRNLERVIRQMDTLSPETMVMRTSACSLYSGCEYRPLCKEAAAAGIDAGDVRGILSLPVIQSYRLAGVHEELEEGHPKE